MSKAFLCGFLGALYFTIGFISFQVGSMLTQTRVNAEWQRGWDDNSELRYACWRANHDDENCLKGKEQWLKLYYKSNHGALTPRSDMDLGDGARIYFSTGSHICQDCGTNDPYCWIIPEASK